MLHPDLLLFHGRLLTNTSHRVTALAISGDRILAVGEDDELRGLRGPKTRVVDLGGRLVTPGFTDSHVHLAALAMRLSGVRLETARTLAEAVRRVAARARVAPKGEWITGGGFDQNVWGGEFPTRHDLDAAAPEHPVALFSHDLHTLWVNWLALVRCGITKRTRCGPDGIVRREAKGEPAGILQEAAIGLVRNSPAYTPGGAGLEDLARALRYLRRYGLTSVHVLERSNPLEALQKLRERGQLAARVTVYPWYTELDGLVAAGLRSGFGDEWLRLGGVKVILDGTLGSQTAWLYRPHEHSDAGCGVPLLTRGELRAILRRAAERGLASSVHAIGDRANAEALDAFAAIRDLRTALPHRLEHAQLLRPEDIPRVADLGLVASLQPVHILGDAALADRHWGARSRGAYAFRSLWRAGATLAFGSDAPVETPDPIAGLEAAVDRTPRGAPPGTHWYPEERLSLRQAVRAYTLGPAMATGEAAVKGRLAPGYLADVVIWAGEASRPRRAARVFLAGKPQ